MDAFAFRFAPDFFHINVIRGDFTSGQWPGRPGFIQLYCVYICIYIYIQYLHTLSYNMYIYIIYNIYIHLRMYIHTYIYIYINKYNVCLCM